MPTERDFLKTIDTDPENRSARLIYADWLEEQGDPRSEIIRVEEEVRNLKVYSDRYWELKPRRPALLKPCPRPWLKRMGCGLRETPMFTDVPNGYRERFRVIHEFTERWYGVSTGDVDRPLIHAPRCIFGS